MRRLFLLLLPVLLLLLVPQAAFAQAFGVTTMLVHGRESVQPNATSGRNYDEVTSESYGINIGFRSPVIGVFKWLRASTNLDYSGWKFCDMIEGELLAGSQSRTARVGAASATADNQLYAATVFRLGLQAMNLWGDDYLHLRGGVQKMLSERHIFNDDSAIFDIENRWEPFLIGGLHAGGVGIEAGAGTGGYLMLDLRLRPMDSRFFWSVRAERHAQKLSGSDNEGLYLFLGLGGTL